MPHICSLNYWLVESSDHQVSVTQPHNTSSSATLGPHPLINWGGGVSRLIDSDYVVSTNCSQLLSIRTPSHCKQLRNRYGTHIAGSKVWIMRMSDWVNGGRKRCDMDIEVHYIFYLTGSGRGSICSEMDFLSKSQMSSLQSKPAEAIREEACGWKHRTLGFSWWPVEEVRERGTQLMYSSTYVYTCIHFYFTLVYLCISPCGMPCIVGRV